MSATELQFRTAAFGGFQKQDVLSYIESSNHTHAEKLEQLEAQAPAREEKGKLVEAENFSFRNLTMTLYDG